MTILYWNINGKNNTSIISKVFALNFDIIIFSEIDNLNLGNLNDFMPDNYKLGTNVYKNIDTIIFHKRNIDVVLRCDQSRYKIYELSVDDKKYLLGAVHLQSKLHCSSDDRKDVIRHLLFDLFEIDNKYKNKGLIVIGDMNCNPFDPEMVGKDSFNAVLFYNEICRKNKEQYNGRIIRRFYNPMMLFLSENEKQYGSYRYTSNTNNYIWYSFDQCIVDSKLASKIKNIKYIKQIGNEALTTAEGIVNKTISDHLPLAVELEE